MSRRVVLFAYLSLFALGICDNLRGTLYPEFLKEYGFTDSQGAWLWALNSLGGAAGSFMTRRLLKYGDRVQVLSWGLVMLFIGLFATAAAPGAGTMFAVWLFFGVALGILAVPQNVLASVYAPEGRRPQVMAGLHSMYGLSSLLAPIAAVAVVTMTGSWRAPFVALALVPAMVWLYSRAAVRREPAPLEEKRREGEKVSRRERLYHLWWAAILGCYVLGEVMISSRIALYFRRELGADLAQSGFALTVFFTSMLAGRLLTAFWKNPLPLVRQLQIALIATGLLIAAGLAWWLWAMALSGFTMGPFYPVGIAYMTGRFRTHVDAAMAMAAGFQAVLTLGMHVVVGALTDSYGLRLALTVGPLMAFAGAFLLTEFNRRTRDEE